MKLVNNIRISVFCKGESIGESPEEILLKLKELIPIELQKEKVGIRRQRAVGFNEQTIHIYEIYIDKERHTSAFIEHLKEKLTSEQKEMLLRQAESRLDEECNFYLRLDKPRLLNNQCWITDSGDCFHIKMNIAVFPRKREAALQTVRKIFGN